MSGPASSGSRPGNARCRSAAGAAIAGVLLVPLFGTGATAVQVGTANFVEPRSAGTLAAALAAAHCYRLTAVQPEATAAAAAAPEVVMVLFERGAFDAAGPGGGAPRN